MKSLEYSITFSQHTSKNRTKTIESMSINICKDANVHVQVILCKLDMVIKGKHITTTMRYQLLCCAWSWMPSVQSTPCPPLTGRGRPVARSRWTNFVSLRASAWTRPTYAAMAASQSGSAYLACLAYRWEFSFLGHYQFIVIISRTQKVVYNT